MIAVIAHLPAGTRVLNLSQSSERMGPRYIIGLGIKVPGRPGHSPSGSLGFPVRALSFTRGAATSPQGSVPGQAPMDLYTHGLELPFTVGPNNWVDPPLPLRPVWLGLVLDTAFYAVLWWVGLALLRKARRGRRTRRELCPACGYNLRGNYLGGCSECGWGR